MNQVECNRQPLRELLDESLANAEVTLVSAHIEQCSYCQRQLEQIAAEDSFWMKASKHLPDSGEILAPFHLINGPKTVEVQLDPTLDPKTINTPVSSSESRPSMETSLLDPPRHPEMLGRIDDFEIESVIGRGGMGIVYKGYDSELNRPVAIKVLAPHLAASGVARQRFAREAQAAAAVVHPNVVPIHSVCSSDRRPYIVMTLVAGRSLEAHVSDHGPLDVKDIVRIGQQVAAGLSKAHRQGLVHRDIKPANILLEHDISRVMITDFGLARAADDAAITQTGWLAGTPHYMSPEQARGRNIDTRSDLFSLGSVMYFMATGREPFRAEKPFAVIQKIVSEQPQSIRAINSEIPSTLTGIIYKLLEKKPSDRFATADVAGAALEDYLAYLQSPESRSKPRRLKTSYQRRWQRILLASATAVLLVAGMTGLGLRLFQADPDPQNQTVPTQFNGLTFEQFDDELRRLHEDITATEANFVSSEPVLESFPSWEMEMNLHQIDELTRQIEIEFERTGGLLPALDPQNTHEPFQNSRGNHDEN